MERLKTYHLLGAAVTEPIGDPRRLFARSVERLVDGFIDHRDYVHAARRARAHSSRQMDFARQVRELIDFDINPVSDLLLGARSERSFESRWNGFNRSAPLGVETIVSTEPVVMVQRRERAAPDVASFRAEVTAACMDHLLAAARRGNAREETPLRLKAQLHSLGIASAVIEDCVDYIHVEPTATLPDSASRLGTSRRTLQRELASFDLSFRTLRQAIRLLIAGHAMRTQTASLTEIAHTAGFFDSAHFVRAWKQSCGMMPSQYRELTTH